MFQRLLPLALLIFWHSTAYGQNVSAKDILKKAIAYHDPNNEWPVLQAQFSFNETRPNGQDRSTTAEINNGQGWFQLERKDIESHGMKMDSCFLLYGEADCDRAARMRNYYLYLWGLPMKLTDEGTPLDDEVREETFEGQDCYILRVPYEEDVWYFYLSKEDYRMIAYKFYKDEATGKGELITTEGVYTYGEMKFANNRTWYVLPGLRVLGTDILTEVQPLDN
ncbi:MAG: DUF6503 family protein [Bacteroidota bacterium]